MRLAEPGWLLLLVLGILPWLRLRARPRVPWPTLNGFGSVRRNWRAWIRHFPVLMRTAAFACMAVALARPQEVAGRTRVAGQGVAIVVALDHSSSMKAEDFAAGPGRVSRLQAAKDTLAQFVAGRPDDLIGVVVFANYPFLKCPPTLDHPFLLETVRALKTAAPSDDGTNIGDALAWSLGALEKIPSLKKAVVLLTDGRNQPAVSRPMDPEAAAQLARQLGVTVHTVAIGQAGGIVQVREPRTGLPVTGEVAGPDVELLARVARAGSGRAFRATDARMLEDVFRTIDRLEKSPVAGTVQTRYRETFAPWVAAALVLLIVDRMLSAGVLARLP